MKIEKPSLESARLLTAFIGETRRGKTLSALRFMRGLVGSSGKLGFIDTEEKRAGVYARDHAFDVINISAPFTPETYIEALRTFEDADYDGVVIDSISHEWEGKGGILEIVDSSDVKNEFTRWKEPKRRHRKFVQDLLRSRMHVAACFRAKEKFSLQKNEQGKLVPVSRGLQVQQDENLPYEFMVQITMRGDGFATVLCPAGIRHAFREDERINEEAGAAVATWLGDVQRDPELGLLQRTAGDEAERGIDALQTFWSTLTKSQQLKLKPLMEDFKGKAREADAHPSHESAANANLENPFGHAAD
jgi:hypothetical protein